MYNNNFWRKPDTSQAEDAIRKAYEFALTHIGGELNSTSIWKEYLSFLRGVSTSSAYDEGVQTTSLRKVYQRALDTPMNNLESSVILTLNLTLTLTCFSDWRLTEVWKDYDIFENKLNKVLARAMIQEMAPKYMKSQTVAKQRYYYYYQFQKYFHI